ncbi:structural maintenance of chromosomes protein 4 [Thraustotheca clavata]|uniref:Structural maintenance of chromosomes protein n=1 Tax=Thraustotheca clavata TaxID=74557 RepID=A0A1W0A1W6_9STRA|nr:structural maintenance of chromosomes protein 4 [Thraustotheca clavata]
MDERDESRQEQEIEEAPEVENEEMNEVVTHPVVEIPESALQTPVKARQSVVPATPMYLTPSRGKIAVPTGPRLMIKKLEVENFKSYAGVREIGPFHKCFSSVVGPNGSGKSNVIDALLFVFGKRAKKLRLSKVSELIHKSTLFQNLREARVSVFFQDIVDTGDGDDDYTVVPNSQLVVTRTANIQNQSKYFIDGRPSNFTEVTTLLRERGIDLDNNRFLILQGEVEQIAMMKSKAENQHDEGLLEYLEDIIGSNKYVAMTEEVMKDVEVLNEARLDKLNRVKVVEKEKENLEDAKSEAQEYLEKERDVYMKTNILFQLYVNESTANMNETREKRDEMKVKLDKESERMRTHREQLEVVQKEYQVVDKQYQKVKADLDAVEAAFAEFEKRDVKVREDIKFSKKQTKDLDAALKKEIEKHENLVKTLEENKASIPDVEQEIVHDQEQLVIEEAERDAIEDSHKAEAANMRVGLEAKQNELAPYQQNLLKIQSAIDTIKTEIQLLKEATVKAQEDIAKNKTAIKDADKKTVEYTERIKSMEKEIGEMEERLHVARAELQEAEDQEKIINRQYQEARAKAEEATQSVQSHATQSRMLKSLMDAARPGFPLDGAGLLGRLGDLGAIDEKYDVAISTACGALDNLVVETTSGAQRCVDHLRRHNLGRATFIILEKIQYLQSKCNSRGPNVSFPRLFDLVRVTDNKFLPAFYFALRDTLVAPTLDEATAIAYQGNQCKYRVVTEDGQLIELSGAMSGGGSRVRRGGMSSQLVPPSMSPAEIQELQREAESLKASLYSVRSSRSSLENEIRSLEGRINSNKTELPKMAMEIDAFKGRKTAMAARNKELEKLVSLSPQEAKKVKNLEKSCAEKEAEYDSHKDEVNAMEAEVQAMKKAILNLGGEKLKKQIKKVKKLASDIDTKTEHLTKLRVDLKTGKKTLEKSVTTQAKLEKDLEATKKRLEELRIESKEIEDKAAEVSDKHEAARKLMEEHESVLNDKKSEFDTLKKTVDQMASREVDLLSSFEECETLLVENEKKVTYWSAKLSDLQTKYKKDEDEIFIVCGDADDENATNGEETKGLPTYDDAALAKFSKEEMKYEISVLEQQRDELKANVNMGAIAEYKKKEKEFTNRVSELEAATNERDAKRKEYEELRRKRLEEFMEGFQAITLKLKEMYQMITLGGDAELELVDSLDPFSEGVVFSVRPSKKSWKNISNLSGGEKTLASLALVFALHHYKPTPLYVMDEIDAALDFKNVSIVGNYIKQRTKNAQFIIISLRNNMFELADRLVGIYKTNNTTKSVTINPKHYAGIAEPTPMTPYKTPLKTPSQERRR